MFFPNYRLRKTWLDKLLKSLVSEHCSTVNMLKGPKHSWNLYGRTFVMFVPRWGKWSCKISPLVIWETLGLLVNTLTTDDKYSLCTSNNSRELIQMQLSKKQKNFFVFFLLFWNLHQILNTLKKKMTLIGYVFPKLCPAKDVVR